MADTQRIALVVQHVAEPVADGHGIDVGAVGHVVRDIEHFWDRKPLAVLVRCHHRAAVSLEVDVDAEIFRRGYGLDLGHEWFCVDDLLLACFLVLWDGRRATLQTRAVQSIGHCSINGRCDVVGCLAGQWCDADAQLWPMVADGSDVSTCLTCLDLLHGTGEEGIVLLLAFCGILACIPILKLACFSSAML